MCAIFVSVMVMCIMPSTTPTFIHTISSSGLGQSGSSSPFQPSKFHRLQVVTVIMLTAKPLEVAVQPAGVVTVKLYVPETVAV